MKLLFATVAGTLACFISGTIIAIAMQPWVGPMLAPQIRTEEMGLLFPSLIAGYFVVGLMLAILGVLTDVAHKSWAWVFKTGAVLGLAIFLGDHLITAGWSKLAAIPMAISGTLDALSVVAAFAAVAFVLKHGTESAPAT